MRIRAAHLRTAGVLVAVLVLGNITALMVGREMTRPLEHHNWVAQYKSEQLDAQQRSCTDIAVIGSSVGLMGIDPDRLLQRLGDRTTAYNAALGGSFLSLDTEWYERFVEPALHPRVVLHVVAFPSLSTDRASAAELQASWDGARASATGLMDEVDRALSNVIPIMRYRERLRDPAEWYALLGGELPSDRRPDEQIDLIRSSGFMAREQVGDPAKIGEYGDIVSRVLRDDGEAIQQEQLQALADHVLRARERGTEVVLVLSPSLAAIRPAMVNDPGDFPRYREAMASLARDVDAQLIDASDLAIPQTDFWDGMHVNVAGATVFTDHVADQLRARGVTARCE